MSIKQILEKRSDILFATHGDFDGLASAALAAKKYGVDVKDINVIFTQPYLVDQIVIPDHIKKVIVTDIARNNRDPAMTDKFIADIGDRLVGWYDHHLGWPYDMVNIDGIFVIHPTAPSCAAILGSGMPRREDFNILQTAMNDAIASDTREGELSPLGVLIEHAIKANMSDDDIRLAAVKLLLGDESQRPVLESAANDYAAVQKETEWLAKGYIRDDTPFSKYDGGVATVAMVDVPDVYCRTYGQDEPIGHEYDLTQLLLSGQKLAKFAVAKTINPQTGAEMITIATKSGVNLVELLGLKGGAPYRVSVPVDRLDEVLEKLKGVV